VYREKLIALLDKQNTGKTLGTLRVTSGKTPIFLMTGRFDLAQKGFDVMFNAFIKLKKGSAKLVFSPTMPNDFDESILAFFHETCRRYDGDILIWPYRLPEKEYHTLLSGASFLLMPSLYEPFGAATEGFIHGTPVIARATGGLLTQVIDPLYYSAEVDSADQNGILYREDVYEQEAIVEWPKILSLAPEKRIVNPVYEKMVTAAEHALIRGQSVFSDSQHYGSCILNGTRLLHAFDWDKAADNYRAVYNQSTVFDIP